MEGIRFVVDAPQGVLGIITDKKRGANTIVDIQSSSSLVNILKIGDVIESVIDKPRQGLDDDSATWVDSDMYRKLIIWRPTPTLASIETVASKPKTTNPNALAPLTNLSSATPKEFNVMEKHFKTIEQALVENVPAQNATNTQETETKIVASLPTLNLDEMPAPGFVCKNKLYYSTFAGETTTMVAEKLGCSIWKELLIDENVKRYGFGLKANSSFHVSTYLRIPNSASQFKLEKLVDQQEIKMQELGICLVCRGQENPNNDDMLLCDRCDVACCHLACSDHDTIPTTEWFCQDCLDILRARHVRHGGHQGGSLVVNGPSKLASLQLSPRLTTLVAKVQEQLVPHLRTQREATLPLFGAKQKEDMQARVDSCLQTKQRAEEAHDSCKNAYNETVTNICLQAGIVAIHLGSLEYPRAVTLRHELLEGDIRLDLVTETRGGMPSQAWQIVMRWINQVKQHYLVESTARARSREAFDEVEKESVALLPTLELELQECKIEYAGMMDEMQLPFETKAMLKRREGRPKLLGFVKVTQMKDANELLALKSPTQLIVTLPLETQEEPDAILPGHDYAVFARSLLFCPTRNDELPLQSHGGTRSAQRHLMEMLSLDERNSATVISRPQVPPTVRARGNPPEDFSKCFDLSELVRDCACDLDLPMAPTPPRLVQHGLQLRDYQKSSLQFMLEKENDKLGLGFAGELWSRNQSFDAHHYYFCNLTGLLQSDIYNYSDDNSDCAAKHCGGLPRGGILADETGLGKSAVCISLILANPPSKENRVLQREHKFEEKPTHSLYSPPPSVYSACTASTHNVFLSNGTIVIAPMTLCSQWQSEIKNLLLCFRR